jgi:hypothetical protein
MLVNLYKTHGNTSQKRVTFILNLFWHFVFLIFSIPLIIIRFLILSKKYTNCHRFIIIYLKTFRSYMLRTVSAHHQGENQTLLHKMTT